MKGNKGFTLVEILVVFAIVAILTGSMVAGFSRINYANFKKAASRLDNEIKDCRGVCMSHDKPAYTYVYNDSGNLYVYSTTNVGEKKLDFAHIKGKGTKIGSSDVTFSYVKDDGTSGDVNAGDVIEISFRLNGSFKESETDTNVAFYKSFSLSGRSGSAAITCTKETGKHYME